MVDQIVPQPAMIDRQGNISLNGREGAVIPVQYHDENDVALDISEAVLFFEVAGKLRKALEPGADATERLIVLTQADVALVSKTPGNAFVVRDETGDVPDVLWEGMISRRGTAEQPSVG
jgi:hypothetical protein